jgi:DNA-binding transcriptional regulator YhcF (GntR family)
VTERRQEYIHAIAEYFRRNDQLPSSEKLGELVGVGPTGAADMYTKLERAGIVSRNEQNKFKRGPQWPQEESWDRQEHDAQTHPVHTAQSATCSKAAPRENSSWLPSRWSERTPAEVTCDCTSYTRMPASFPEESWFSKTHQH